MIVNLKVFTTSLTDYQKGITDYLNNTSLILSYVASSDGLLADTSCLFIGDALGNTNTLNFLDNMFDALCPAFFTSLWGLSKILIVLAFGLYFGTFCIWCTAMKYAKN